MFQARSELFDQPFEQYALPQAILRFKQGFGRLIRRKTDRGVMVVLDRRLRSRRYGDVVPALAASVRRCATCRCATSQAEVAAWLAAPARNSDEVNVRLRRCFRPMPRGRRVARRRRCLRRARRERCRILDAASKRNRGVISRSIERDDEQVGVLIAEIGRPDRHAAIIELVALAPGHARRGSGMRAAAMIETELRESGVSRVYAPAPAAHGIAVYFWIRLGYHPLLQPEWPCARDGVAWMMRELTA